MPNDLNSNAAGATPATGATPGAAENTTTQTPGATDATSAAGATPPPDTKTEFDSWLAGQDEPTRNLISSRFSTLESTLATERETRKELSKQLKDLSSKLDANSEAAKQLSNITATMEAERQRADFYEAATVAGCVKPKLAYLVAQSEGLKVEQIKAQYPELFAQPRHISTHAGNGTGTPPPNVQNMDDLIRQAANVR